MMNCIRSIILIGKIEKFGEPKFSEEGKFKSSGIKIKLISANYDQSSFWVSTNEEKIWQQLQSFHQNQEITVEAKICKDGFYLINEVSGSPLIGVTSLIARLINLEIRSEYLKITDKLEMIEMLKQRINELMLEISADIMFGNEEIPEELGEEWKYLEDEYEGF